MPLIDDERRLAILAPIDDSVGIDGRADEGAAGELLRELRSQRKALVRIEQAAAMNDDDIVIPEGGWDWETLTENAVEYLATHGKDLEPMTIVIEAAARSDGLDDLAAAMTLLADFVEAFWDQGLYPAEDEDGVESRFQPLSGLSGGSNDKDGALILPVRKLAIAQAAGETLRYLDKVRAEAAMAASQGASGDQKTARIEEAGTLSRGIEQLSRRLSAEVLKRAAANAAAAEEGWRRAIGFISERTKPQFPAASRLLEDLRNIHAWIKAMAPTSAPETGKDDAVEGETADGTPSETSGDTTPAGGFVAGRITRREDALKAITAAAEYFLQFEPLSPLGTSLREVDRRARMSFHDLLSELIPDESARKDYYWRSGIRPPSGAGDDE